MKCNLSTLMGERRLKISDVAKQTGINRGTITRIYNEEATRVDLNVINTLCNYFDIEIGDLYIRTKFSEKNVQQDKDINK